MKAKLLYLFTLLTSFSALHAQWTVQNTGFANATTGVKSISIVNENVVWALGYDGSGNDANYQVFTKTTDGGTTWTPGTISIGNTGSGIAMIHAISDTTAWIAVFPNATGQPQGIYKTVNGGTTWARQNTAFFIGSDAFANIVHFFDANNGVCMGDPNGGYFEIYTSVNGGTNWSRVPSANIPAPLSGEYGYVGQVFTCGDGNTVWFTTNKGRIYRSANKGLNWTVSQSPITDFGGEGANGEIAFKDANNGVLVSNETASTTVFHNTSDGGVTWNLVLSNGSNYGGDVAFVPGTDFLVTTGAATGASGSSYSSTALTTAPSFTDIDSDIQHLDVQFFNLTTGWTGGFNTDSTTGGIFKWTGTFMKVSDDLKLKGLIAYPNPVQDFLNLQAKENINEVEIYNAIGQRVIILNPNNMDSKIDMSALPHGTYIVKISIGDTTGSLKLVK